MSRLSMADTKPTPVRAWAGPATVTVTLPSGNIAELRDRFPVYMLLRTGQFSEEMFAAFAEWQRGELADPALAADLVDLMVEAMFVNPKVSREQKAGSLSIDQISEVDIEFVIAGAAGGAPDPGFPGDANGVSGGADSPDVGADPVEPAGDDAGDADKPPARSKARRATGASRSTS